MIIGHRGARDLWPENSLSGFRSTAELGVDGVELDVHLTDADEVVVIHDPTLDRTTEGTGDVARLTAESRLATPLRDTDGEPVPLLTEALDVFRGTDMDVWVEVKVSASGDLYPGLVQRTMAIIADLDMRDQCVLTSFHPEVMEEGREIDPTCRTLASISANSVTRAGGLDAAIARLASIADVLAVEKSLLASDFDDIVARRPLEELCVWVPNTEEEIATWMSRGLPRVVSDRPDLALRLCDSTPPASTSAQA